MFGGVIEIKEFPFRHAMRRADSACLVSLSYAHRYTYKHVNLVHIYTDSSGFTHKASKHTNQVLIIHTHRHAYNTCIQCRSSTHTYTPIHTKHPNEVHTHIPKNTHTQTYAQKYPYTNHTKNKHTDTYTLPPNTQYTH